MADEWDALIKRASDTFRELLIEAANIGYKSGRAKEAAALREKIAEAIGIGAQAAVENVRAAVENSKIVAESDSAPDTSQRAAPGSVKPVVLGVVRGHPGGLTTEEVRQLTQLKPNSVRGTLWTLSSEDKLVIRRDGKWFPLMPRGTYGPRPMEKDKVKSSPGEAEESIEDLM